MRERFLTKSAARSSTPKPAARANRRKMNALQDRKLSRRFTKRPTAACRSSSSSAASAACGRKSPAFPKTSASIASGRFLEHSRIFYFSKWRQREYYIGSADWMYRNLDYRVERLRRLKIRLFRVRLKESSTPCSTIAATPGN